MKWLHGHGQSSGNDACVAKVLARLLPRSSWGHWPGRFQHLMWSDCHVLALIIQPYQDSESVIGIKKGLFCLFDQLRFSNSLWMGGYKRGYAAKEYLNDELRVAYLKEADEKEAIDMAQLEWAPWMHMFTWHDHDMMINYYYYLAWWCIRHGSLEIWERLGHCFYDLIISNHTMINVIRPSQDFIWNAKKNVLEKVHGWEKEDALSQRRWLSLRELLLTSSRRCQKSPGAYGLKSKQKRCGFKSKEHMKADSRMHHWLLWWALSIVLILLAALRNGSNESWSIAAKDQHWEETSQWVLEGEKGKTRHLFQEPWERSPGHQENLGSIGCKYCWMKVTWLNICFLRTCQHGSNRQSILCWISPGRSLAQDYWPFPWISSLGIISLPNF